MKQLRVFGTCSRLLTLMVIVPAGVAVLRTRLESEGVSPTGMVIRVAGGEIHVTLPDEQLKIFPKTCWNGSDPLRVQLSSITATSPSPGLPFESEPAAGTG